MAVIIILGITLWAVSAMTRALNEQRKARKIERLREEQTRLRNEHNAMIRRQLAMEREQERARKEEEKLVKEQAKQAAQLAKHEKRISDLEYKMEQAERDMDFLRDRIAQLDAQRDNYLLLQAGTVPGGKEHTKYQNKIVLIDNQIHTAENKLAKAQHTHKQAARELSA